MGQAVLTSGALDDLGTPVRIAMGALALAGIGYARRTHPRHPRERPRTPT